MFEVGTQHLRNWRRALEGAKERDAHGEEKLDATALRDAATWIIEEIGERLEAEEARSETTRRYRVYGTVSDSVTVEAHGPEEAKRLAQQEELGEAWFRQEGMSGAHVTVTGVEREEV